MTAETFEKEFLRTFMPKRENAEEILGSSRLTRIERVGMRKLLEKFGNSEDARRDVIEHGFPLIREEVGPTDLGETAYMHACIVAAYLNKTRGEEAAPDTVESYITKNRFDRWVSFNLTVMGKMSGTLEREWNSPQNRESGYKNTEQVQYPKGVDDKKIYGVAKPHRYWPAQLLRYLEYMRLGKITDTDEMNKLGMERGREDKYKIEWSNFIDVLKQEETVDGIAIGIAVKTMEILKDRDLGDDQIAKVILAGYSPGGPMNEHGDIPQVHEIWNGIIDRVANSEQLKTLKESLISGVNNKMASINSEYVFNYQQS